MPELAEVQDIDAARVTVGIRTPHIVGAVLSATPVEVEEMVRCVGVMEDVGHAERIDHPDGGPCAG